MEKKIRQKIELDAEGKAKLAKAFGVTVQNVSQALRFKGIVRQPFKLGRRH